MQKRPSLPQRPAAHVLEERSRRAVRAALPPEWTIQDVGQDYGCDLLVEVWVDGYPTGYEFGIQIKAAKTLKRSGEYLVVTVPWKTIRYLMQRPMPAMIVAYEGDSERIYYRWLSEYLAATEYGKTGFGETQTLRVRFPSDAILSPGAVTDILDYFAVAGVPIEDAKRFLERLSSSGAQERYDLLKHLRFVRDEDSVLYLMSQLSLDLVLGSVGLVDVSSLAMLAFIDVASTSLSHPLTFLFWGLAADLAIHENHTMSQISSKLFTHLVGRFRGLSSEILARQTYELFGYSSVAGLILMRHGIDNSQFGEIVNSVVEKIRPLRANFVPSPQAADWYTALYTVQVMEGSITYLSDTQLRQMWIAYEQGDQIKAREDNWSDESVKAFRVAALHSATGFSTRLEGALSQMMDEQQSRAAMDDFASSMAARKLSLFDGLFRVREEEMSQDRSSWTEGQLAVFAAGDMLKYFQVFWYGRALDFFELPCFVREEFHGGR